MEEVSGFEFKKEENEKILLALLPFWTPLIPPLGISLLKSYIQHFGFDVTTVDGNKSIELMGEYYKYNDLLKKFIPDKMKGNFYNIAQKVLSDHLMAYINRNDDNEYIKLIKIIIENNFFCDISEKQIYELDNIISIFFSNLKEYIIQLIENKKPTVIGLSVYSGNLPASIYVFKIIKERYPHIKTIMGGGIFANQLKLDTPNFKRFVENTWYIDKIIVGEGEELFLKYLQGKLPKEQKVYTLKDNENRSLELSSSYIPDFTDFDVTSYTQLASYVSRSCPFQCKFCSETVQWGEFRKKNIKQVVDELTELYKKHNSQLFLLGDSLINPFITELSEELIERDTSIYIDGYLRADKNVCNIENTLKWRRGGLYRARLGLESGSQRILNLMDKRITVEQIRSALSSLAYAGIKTTTYWVIGFPGETEEDFMETLNLIEELKDDIWEAECNPFSYFIDAQVGSDRWQKEYGISRLYPKEASELLMTEEWTVNCEPERKIIFDRVRRFEEHCKKLGLYNTYSLYDIYLADERWKKLHSNAVPNILEFKNDVLINENKKIKMIR